MKVDVRSEHFYIGKRPWSLNDFVKRWFQGWAHDPIFRMFLYADKDPEKDSPDLDKEALDGWSDRAPVVDKVAFVETGRVSVRDTEHVQAEPYPGRLGEKR